MPTLQNGQTHLNNSSATADELFKCVWPFCGVGTWRVNSFHTSDLFLFPLMFWGNILSELWPEIVKRWTIKTPERFRWTSLWRLKYVLKKLEFFTCRELPVSTCPKLFACILTVKENTGKKYLLFSGGMNRKHWPEEWK